MLVSTCELFILVFSPAVREPPIGFGLLNWHWAVCSVVPSRFLPQRRLIFLLFLVLAGCVFRRTISSCSGLSPSCLLIFCGGLIFVLKKVIVIMSKSCVEVKFVRPIVRSMRTFLSGKCVFVGSVETW